MKKETNFIEKPAPGTEWRMFSAVGRERIIHQHAMQVEMVTEMPLIEVYFQIAENESDTTHWGWLQDQKIDFIQPTLDLLNMCFPYDPIHQERAGVGLRIPLILLPSNT
ncbi:MAG: hypothetical protein RSD49_07960 [Hafnia sp.]